MAGWVDSYLKPVGDEQWAKMQMVEFGGMEEALFNLYAITGKEQHLALARRFDHKKFFDPLAEGKDELKGLHAKDRKSTRLNSSHGYISYAVFCLKKKKTNTEQRAIDRLL